MEETNNLLQATENLNHNVVSGIHRKGRKFTNICIGGSYKRSTSLTPPCVIEVPVPKQEGERSCICVLGDFGKFRQCGICWFSFNYYNILKSTLAIRPSLLLNVACLRNIQKCTSTVLLQ
jgi:hypothetical protein